MSERVSELDGVRGIACLLVLADHVIVSGLPPGTLPGVGRLVPWLIGGVDLFFVLSGFLIGGILLDNRSATNYFRAFWLRRIARIWPVYYLLVFSFFAVVVARPIIPAPWLDRFLLKDAMPLWTYPTFLQNFAQGASGLDGGARWVASTWSLAIEEQFYLLLPPLVLLMSRRGITVLAVVCVLGAWPLRTLLQVETGTWTDGYFLLPGRMDSLGAGLLAAIVLRTPEWMAVVRRLRPFLDGLAVATVLFLLGNGLIQLSKVLPSPGALLTANVDFTLRSVLFAWGILRVFAVSETSRYRRVLNLRLFTFTGFISYSLYMYHPVINGLFHGWAFADVPHIPDGPHLLLAIAVIAASYLCAWVSTTWMEIPIRRLAHRAHFRHSSSIPEKAAA